MPRIRLTVAYVGTNYQGWQVQGRGATVQGTIEDRLARVCMVRGARIRASMPWRRWLTSTRPSPRVRYLGSRP